MVHLLWHCPFVRPFWQNVCEFITRNIDDQFMLFWKHILFGIWENSRIFKHSQIYIIYFIILMARFYVHKCKFSSKKKNLLYLI